MHGVVKNPNQNDHITGKTEDENMAGASDALGWANAKARETNRKDAQV